jgi:hypothetical protein
MDQMRKMRPPAVSGRSAHAVNDHRNERFSRDKAFDSNSIIAELPQLARPNAASAKIEVH